MLLWEGRGEIWLCNVKNAQAVMEEAMVSAPALEACQVGWGTKTGARITVLPSTVNGTDRGLRNGSMPSSSATA